MSKRIPLRMSGLLLLMVFSCGAVCGLSGIGPESPRPTFVPNDFQPETPVEPQVDIRIDAQSELTRSRIIRGSRSDGFDPDSVYRQFYLTTGPIGDFDDVSIYIAFQTDDLDVSSVGAGMQFPDYLTQPDERSAHGSLDAGPIIDFSDGRAGDAEILEFTNQRIRGVVEGYIYNIQIQHGVRDDPDCSAGSDTPLTCYTNIPRNLPVRIEFDVAYSED
ncbi:MAG TPA: hypothetical protein P5081_24405 [Phycisphaerae bacterium]|nr:hypothetical protein [Phycisphaerae bacterium]